jgi:hypothetical protein
MAISLMAVFSLIGCSYYGFRVVREYRRQKLESRMCRAVRLAFLN